MRVFGTAAQPHTVPFLLLSPSGGGSGGSRKKLKRNGGVGCPREVSSAVWVRFQWTPMRTQKYRITRRSARCSHCPFSKWVRTSFSISAQIETSSELRTEDRREAAAESKRARRFATNCPGEGTQKRAVLSRTRDSTLSKLKTVKNVRSVFFSHKLGVSEGNCIYPAVVYKGKARVSDIACFNSGNGSGCIWRNRLAH